MPLLISDLLTLSLVSCLWFFAATPALATAEPTAAAASTFNTYSASVEARLAQQHRSPETFLVSSPAQATRLRHGEPLVERITQPSGPLPGALLHHWRATAFAPGATAAGFERLIKDFNAYPKTFSPEVLEAKVISQQDDRLQAAMRVRQKHVITVVMDTTYNVTFGRLDAQHGYSASVSTNVSEIDFPGSAAERALPPAEEHGFLWRQNTFWTYAERDGGLYLQVESVSLSRSIPRGLAWAIQPFVESVPRESLEFTLRSVCGALRK